MWPPLILVQSKVVCGSWKDRVKHVSRGLSEAVRKLASAVEIRDAVAGPKLNLKVFGSFSLCPTVIVPERVCGIAPAPPL